MAVLFELDQQIADLDADSQFTGYLPKIGVDGAAPPLGPTKGASLITPSVGPYPKWIRFSPDANQPLIKAAGVLVGGRPRSMGEITAGDPPEPLPDGSLPELGVRDDGVTGLQGVSGQDRHYECEWLVPTDGVMPYQVRDSKGKLQYPHDAPWVIWAWHGETSLDEDDHPPLDAFGRPTRPQVKQFGHPVVQFHMKRLNNTAAVHDPQNLYVTMIGGRYKPQKIQRYVYPNTRPIAAFQANHAYAQDDLILRTGSVAMRAKVAFTSGSAYVAADWATVAIVYDDQAPPAWPWEGVSSSADPTVGTAWVECTREYRIFPAATGIPLGTPFHMQVHIHWHDVMGQAVLEVWLNDQLVVNSDIDSATGTVPLEGPVGGDGNPRHGGGACIYKSDLTGNRQVCGHMEVGYYRPDAAPKSSYYYDENTLDVLPAIPGLSVWTQSIWMTGMRMTQFASDLVGSGGPGGGGGTGVDPPSNNLPPQILGFWVPGAVLTVLPGDWDGDDLAFSYAWKRDGQTIAIGSSYPVQAGDATHDITVTETAMNTAGVASATSDPATIINPPDLRPKITGYWGTVLG